MHNVSQTYMDILAGRYVVDMALMVADDRPAQICTDDQLMARNDPAHPGNGPVYREDYISEMKTKASTFSGANPEIGAVTCRQINLELRNPAQIIPRAARLVPFERIRNGEQASEWIPKGVFYIDTRDTEPGYQDARGNDVEFLEIYGNDALMKAEADYPAHLTVWPVDWPIAAGIPVPEWPNALDISVMAEIAVFLGVQIEPETIAAINRGYRVPTSEYFCPREILSQIAIAYAGNFGMDDFGRLQFRRANAAAGRASVNIQGNVDDFHFGETLPPVTRVELTNGEDETYTAGSPSGRTITAETPWASETLAASVLADVQGMTYQPMTAKGAVIDPAVELGDTLTVGGVTSRMYSQDLTFGEAASSDLQAPSDNDTDHEFTFKKKQERRTARAIAGLGKAVVAEHGFANEIKGGLEQITDFYVDPVTGQKMWILNEQKLYAAISDPETGTFKEGFLQIGAYYDPDKKESTTLAQIVADGLYVDTKKTVLDSLRVDATGTIHAQKSITSDNAVTGKSIYANGTGTQGIVSGRRLVGLELAINGTEYEGKDITSTDGNTHTVLGYK